MKFELVATEFFVSQVEELDRKSKDLIQYKNNYKTKFCLMSWRMGFLCDKFPLVSLAKQHFHSLSNSYFFSLDLHQTLICRRGISYILFDKEFSLMPQVQQRDG